MATPIVREPWRLSPVFRTESPKFDKNAYETFEKPSATFAQLTVFHQASR
jgi:hypothetical protein